MLPFYMTLKCFSGLSPRPSFLLFPWSLFTSWSILIASNTIHIWPSMDQNQLDPIACLLHPHGYLKGNSNSIYPSHILDLLKKNLLHFSRQQIAPPDIYLLQPEAPLLLILNIPSLSYPIPKPTVCSNPVPSSSSKTYLEFHFSP